jgi:sugar phosphate permease
VSAGSETESIMAETADTPARRATNAVINGRWAWFAWALGATAYAVAVFQRSSLGMAGIEAAQHFGVGPALLAMFTTLQLFVYALMQVPVGLLVDRFGPRRLLSTGLLLMALGQCAFALTDSVGAGIAARVLVGCGDAMAFVSVLRLVAAWFPARRGALFTQLTALAGITGNLVAAAPLSALLRNVGWTPTFLVAAAVAAIVLVPVATLLRDRPGGTVDPGPVTPRVPVRRQLADAWERPGTRLGMWVHFTTGFSGSVFALLWGYPFLAEGQGLTVAAAGTLISLLILTSLVFGQVYGLLLVHRPESRFPLALGTVVASMLSWAVVLCWPGQAPIPLLVVHVLVLATNMPGSMIGFEYARDANPTHRLGTASGLVNVGGFGAAVLTTFAIGAGLQLVPGGYRFAFALQFVVYAVGLTAMIRLARTVRRERVTRPTPEEAALEQVEALG